MLSYEHIQTGFLWPRSARSDESLRVETEIWRQDLFLGRIRFPVGDSIRFTQGTPVENAAAVVESFLELASGAGP